MKIQFPIPNVILQLMYIIVNAQEQELVHTVVAVWHAFKLHYAFSIVWYKYDLHTVCTKPA